jgi:hypothetical protein
VSEAEGGEEKKECSPIAQVLVWMAWQGRACAASQRLPGEVFTKPTPGASHLDASTGEHRETQAPEQAQLAQQAPARRGTASGVLGGGRSRGERSPRSPRREGGRRFHLVELVGGAGASDSPEVVAAMVAGVGRNGQAAAAAIQIARGVDGRQRGERVGLGWVGLTDPDPSQVGLAESKWAGWAGWPDGPNWLWVN